MWEHFTSKKYFDDGSLKRVGEIETPWNGWHIAARGPEADERIAKHLLPSLKEAIQFFEVFDEMSVQFIVNSKEHSYSMEDAQAWYNGVKFASREQMGTVNKDVMTKTFDILKTAGVLGARSLRSVADVEAARAEIYRI